MVLVEVRLKENSRTTGIKKRNVSAIRVGSSKMAAVVVWAVS